ncbi:MAG: hypothetical protein ABSA66_11010 [Roseiarcus sp.]
MQNFGAADGLLGLLEWSEPVIFDRLRETYRARVAEEALIWNLARQHCRVWRALIVGDMGKFEVLRRELVGTLERLGLNIGCVVDADAQTLTELNEIVAARFQRCARLAQGYRLALTELAGRLAPAGRAA